MTRLAGVVVVPDGGGQGENALQHPGDHPAGVCPPWRSRSSWPLRVSLTDSMVWRSGLKNCAPGLAGSPWRAGRSRCGGQPRLP